jgi:hypothetical protein
MTKKLYLFRGFKVRASDDLELYTRINQLLDDLDFEKKSQIDLAEWRNKGDLKEYSE